jgi:hypothetical protein
MKIVLFLAALIALPASADVLLDGQVSAPRSWSVADLKSQTPLTVETSYLTGHGEEHARFTGVPLWALLIEAKLSDKEGKLPGLRHTVTVTGRDGYAVAVAFGEVDPEFEAKSVLVAYERDGKPIEGLQLVMPGDKRGGRYVHDIVHIEVK